MFVSNEDSLTVRQAADLLKISEQTLRLWMRNRKLSAWKLGGEWRVSKNECLLMGKGNFLMSKEDAALYLDIDIEQLEKLCFDKRLMPFMFRKDNLFFSKEEIDEWMRSLVKKLL